MDIFFRKISFVLISLTALFLSFRNIYGEDIGFHLQAGRWMLENFSFPDKDTFTYTANENKYIDLNWLYQLWMYGVYSIGGSTGLILINSAFIICSVILLFRRSPNAFSSISLPWIILIGIIAISPTFEIRPHSLSWLLLSVTLYILQQYYDGNKKIIRWLPAIMLVWVNCHSLFILGIVATGCYGASIAFNKNHLFKKFSLWSILAILICLINPYGWHGFSLPFEQLFALQEGNIFKENIRELQNPFAITEYEPTIKNLFTKWHFFDLFVAIAVIGLISRIKKLHIHEWLICIIFFYFAYSATKNIGYFVFAITPIIGKGSLTIEKNKKQNSTQRIKKYSNPSAMVFLLICTVLILSIRTNAFYIHYRISYRFGFDWSNSNLPVKATEFLIKNGLHGKMLNQLDFGGYLEFFTNQKVAIDGRLDVMGEKLFSEQINSVSTEAKTNLLAKYNPDIILFAYYVTPDWITFLQNRADWRLAYADECAALYLKNTYAPSIPNVDEKIFTLSIPYYSDAQIDSILQSKKSNAILSSFLHTQCYPEDALNKTAFCFYYNWIGAAKQITANGFGKASDNYPELYQNLGTIYFQLKDKNRSLYCYEKYLETTKNKHVEERVKFLKGL